MMNRSDLSNDGLGRSGAETFVRTTFSHRREVDVGRVEQEVVLVGGEEEDGEVP